MKPDDGSAFWYPQCGKNNPLQAGRAFSCFAHFGNPNGIDSDPAVSYQVRVYALSAKWGYGSNRLDDDQLKERLARLEPIFPAPPFDIQRGSPVNTISISGGGAPHIWTDTVRKIRCSAPVQINWRGQPDAHIEIRAGACDSELFSQFVRAPVVLTVPGCKVGARRKSIVLAGPGLYRVRLYPFRSTFMDPPYECWLDVGDGAEETMTEEMAPRRVLGELSRVAVTKGRTPRKGATGRRAEETVPSHKKGRGPRRVGMS